MRLRIKVKKRDIQYICIFFLFLSIFLLPSYFAIDFGNILPLFSIQRIIAIIATLVCFLDIKKFLKVCSLSQINLFLGMYIIFTYFSGIANGSFMDKSWLGIILEQILIFYLFVYFIRYEYSIKEMINLIKICTIILCILGIVEYINGESFYSILQTTERELWTGNFIRGGSYRIMGPFNHALAYGMVLVAVFPICCYDIKKKKINIFNNKILSILILINIFLTGSRSTLLVLVLEIFLIFLDSEVKNKLKLIVLAMLLSLILIVYVNYVNNTMTKYMLTMFHSIIDIIFGTNFSTEVIYSADITVGYRLNLLKLFVSPDINPLIGNGYSYSVGYSIDNNYVGIYMKTGWLGLISFLMIIIYMVYLVLKKVKTKLAITLVISTIGYCTHLFFVNELHTISVLFILLAMMYCIYWKQIFDNSMLL